MLNMAPNDVKKSWPGRVNISKVSSRRKHCQANTQHRLFRQQCRRGRYSFCTTEGCHRVFTYIVHRYVFRYLVSTKNNKCTKMFLFLTTSGTNVLCEDPYTIPVTGKVPTASVALSRETSNSSPILEKSDWLYQ
jgi:hypothetical protein